MFKTLRSKLLFGTIISVVVINIIFTIFIALFLENTLRTDIIKEITNIKSFSINTINQNELIGESKWKSLNSIKGLTNSYVSMINDKGEINEYVSVVISEDEINNIVNESKNLKSIIRFKRLNNIYCVTYNYPIYLEQQLYGNLIIQKDYSNKYNNNLKTISIIILGQAITVLAISLIINKIITREIKPLQILSSSMEEFRRTNNSDDVIIIINIHDSNEQCVFEISNKCSDIPAEVSGKLLEPFIKYNKFNDMTREVSSSGLGLYLCKELAEKNNGEISYCIDKNIITFLLKMKVKKSFGKY